MDVRKPIIDNFSNQGKFFDNVNSSRNQSNLRQINMLQDISKQTQIKSKYQKLMEHIKQKPIYEIFDKNKSPDQELTQQVQNYYAEMQKIFPRTINRRRISSNDQNVLSHSIDAAENLRSKQGNKPGGSPRQAGNLNQSILVNSRNNGNQNSALKQSRVNQISVKTPKKEVQIEFLNGKVKTQNDQLIEQNSSQDIKVTSQKKRKRQKKSVFHILSDSDDQSSVDSDRGNFVSEEYTASNQVFSMPQNQLPNQTSENYNYKINESSKQGHYQETASRKSSNQMSTPTKFIRNFFSVYSDAKFKTSTEPDNNQEELMENSVSQNISSLYNIDEKNTGFSLQKRINSKFKPINASLNNQETNYNKSGLYPKENLVSLNIPILQPLNLQGKQSRSLSKRTDDSDIYQTLSGSKTTKANRDMTSRNSSSFSIHYDNSDSSHAEKKSRFATIQTSQQQNSTEFYYGTHSPTYKRDLPNKGYQNIQSRRYKNNSNDSRLYHFDFIKEDLSPTMHSEKRSLRIIQKLFEQSKEIQKIYKTTENKISKIQNSIYDSLQKSITGINDDVGNEVNEQEVDHQNHERNQPDQYQKLLIHTGLTANQENITLFQTELRKKSSEIHQEASSRNMQKLKKGNSGVQQKKKMKQEFPLQKMPQSIADSGKFQAVMQANNFSVE